MEYGDLVQAALAARVSSCWSRLEDVVDELISLHAADPAEIVDRVLEISDHPDEGGVVDLRFTGET